MARAETLCPCSSGAVYADCCKPYHDRVMEPSTAVALMRSRYSAFVYGAIDYLVRTTLPARRSANSEAQYQSTHESIKWIGLEVIQVFQGGDSDKTGKVEFKADFVKEGVIATHHECSRFRRSGERWYYVDGVIDP